MYQYIKQPKNLFRAVYKSLLILAFAIIIPLLSPNTTYALTTTVIKSTYDGSTQTFGQTGNYQYAGQGFQIATSNQSLTNVKFCLEKVGSPTDNVKVEVYAHSSGLDAPTGTALVTSDVVAGSGLSTSCASLSTFTFSTQYEITASTQYWFVLSRSGSLNDTNYYRIRVHSSGGYSGGRQARYDGTEWSTGLTSYDVQGEFTFDTFIPPRRLYIF